MSLMIENYLSTTAGVTSVRFVCRIDSAPLSRFQFARAHSAQSSARQAPEKVQRAGSAATVYFRCARATTVEATCVHNDELCRRNDELFRVGHSSDDAE